MAKGASGRGKGPNVGSSGRARGSSSRGSANSRMWSEPATAAQLSALKANGKYDGKYYSKGRAGQTIGESVRAAGKGPSTPQRSRVGARRGRPPLAVPSIAPVAGLSPIVLRDDSPEAGAVLAVAAATPLAPVRATTPMDGPRPRSFALFDELEQRHLNAYLSEHSSNWGHLLRAEIEAWDSLRSELMAKMVTAHSELVAILRGAPAGAIPDPAETATQLLDTASPNQLEEQHLRTYLSDHSSNWGHLLRAEIDAWVTTRIGLAKAKAPKLVELLHQQARQMLACQPQALSAGTEPEAPEVSPRDKEPAGHKAPRNRSAKSGDPAKGRTYLATVTRINAHGAVTALDSGEQGWLHVSKLRSLNGGAYVESVSDVLKTGQQLRVRGIGRSERGQVVLALVGATASPPAQAEVPATTAQPVETSAIDDRRGVFSGLRWGRLRRTQP